jgi:hypothetical protein
MRGNRMEAVSLSTLRRILSKVDLENKNDFGSFVDMLFDECHVIVEDDIDDILDYLEYNGIDHDSSLRENSSTILNELWEFINNLFYE